MRRSMSGRTAWEAGRSVGSVVVGLAALAVLGASPRLVWATGACCLGDNTCGDLDFEDCPTSGVGYWWGQGTSCDGIGAFGQPGGPCDLGACCQRRTPSEPSGSCDNTTRAECIGICGKWMGGTSACSQFGCSTCADVFINTPPLPCDCNEDGEVKLNEVVTALLSGLCHVPGAPRGPCCVNEGGVTTCSTGVGGNFSPAVLCPAADRNGDGQVLIDEVIQGVGVLNGKCFE